GGKGEFLGRPVRANTAGVAAVLGRGVAAGTGPVCGDGELRTSGREAAQLSQRLLCARFRDPAGDAAGAGGARPRPEFSPARAGAVPAAGRGRADADPGSVLARHLDAAGGAGGGDPDRRGGECGGGVEEERACGPGGGGGSAGRCEGPVGGLGFGGRGPGDGANG